MFAEPPRRHRPARVKQMMHHHQKQRAQAKAQKEHERQQPGKGELPDPVGADRRAYPRPDPARRHQDYRHIPPFRQIQRRNRGGWRVCGHKPILSELARKWFPSLWHKSNRDGVVLWGARASRPPLSASGRKHSPLNAVGGTPTAATGTVALPNPKRKVAVRKFMRSFLKSLFTDKLLISFLVPAFCFVISSVPLVWLPAHPPPSPVGSVARRGCNR